MHLKQVLDARGLYVPVASLPTDPDWENDDGNQELTPLPDFPTLVLVHTDDGWRYASETLSVVPALYRQTFSPVSLWFQTRLPSVFLTRVGGFALWQVAYAVVLVVLAWLVGQMVRLLLRGQVRRLVRRLELELDERTYARTNGPLVLLAMTAVLLWGVSDLQLDVGTAQVLHSVGWLAVALSGVTVALRFIDVALVIGISFAGKTESKLDDQVIPLLHQAARYAMFAVAVVLVLDVAGVDVWKLAAGVGIGGLAFALAAQDSVANFFGSVNIFVDRPFQIGDPVKIGNVEGVVEEVGFRSTRVRTYYNSLVTIPNSKITNANVDNLGQRPRRRTRFTLGLTYDTPPDTIEGFVAGVRAILAANPWVQRSYEVHFSALGASGLEVMVHYHVVVPSWHEELVARSRILMEIMRLAEQLGVTFAYPSTSVYLESTPDRPLPPHARTALEELSTTANAFGPGGTDGRPDGPVLDRTWTIGERQERGEI